MLRSWLLGCILLGLSAAAPGPTKAYADPSNDAILFDLEAYRYGLSLGRTDGRYFFEGNFIADCTFLTLNSRRVGHWIDYVDNVLHRPFGRDSYGQGYRAGWVIGYLRAYHLAYDGCQRRLDANIRAALANRLQTCQALASEASQSLIIDPAMNLIPAHAFKPEDAEDLLGMVYFGSRSTAWDKLLSYDEQFISALPCVAVMMKAVKDMLQERIPSS